MSELSTLSAVGFWRAAFRSETASLKVSELMLPIFDFGGMTLNQIAGNAGMLQTRLLLTLEIKETQGVETQGVETLEGDPSFVACLGC